MRFALVALLAGCAFHAHAAGGDDGSGGPTALIDDTAADFQQGSSVSYEGAIDPLQGHVEREHHERQVAIHET